MSDSPTERLVRETFFRRHPASAARALERCSPDELTAVIGAVPPEVAGPVVAMLDRDRAR